jgi:hypothetical protein
MFTFLLYCSSKPFVHAYQLISSTSFYISEQGRRNDLNQQKVDNMTTNDHHLSSSVIVSSGRVHCYPLTQSPVASGWSCHTTANSSKKDDVDSFVGPNIISPPPLWVHVFSAWSSTTSLHTQCASATSMYVKSKKIFHRRSRCAK